MHETIDQDAPARPVVFRTILEDNRVHLPEEICEAAHVANGWAFEIEVTDAGILLRPLGETDPDQAWYWTPEWQAGEREADADIAAGRGTVYHSTEEFFAALDAIDAELDRADANV